MIRPASHSSPWRLALGKLRFYFDGESEPRLAVDADALFTGWTTPFVYPLVADNHRSGGLEPRDVPRVLAVGDGHERRRGLDDRVDQPFPVDRGHPDT